MTELGAGGLQVQLRPLAPGMMQQVQAPCTRCGGTGYQVPADDQCGSCAGKGLIPEKKVFEVHINKVPPCSLTPPIVPSPFSLLTSVTSAYLTHDPLCFKWHNFTIRP